MNKKCIKCNAIKSPDCFTIGKNTCKECKNEYGKNYYKKNKEIILSKNKIWRENNKEKCNDYSYKYRQENKEKIKKSRHDNYIKNKEEILNKNKKWRVENKEYCSNYNKEYRITNKEAIKEQRTDYRKNNKEKERKRHKNYVINNREEVNKYQNDYNKEKRKNEPCFKIHCAVSSKINFYIKKSGKSKGGKKCLEYLPFESWQILINHIDKLREPWMTWDNYGIYNPKTWDDNDKLTWTWQIDHIIPQSDLPYDSMKHPNFKKCWALENLRPYSAKQNILDGSTRIRHKKKNE